MEVKAAWALVRRFWWVPLLLAASMGFAFTWMALETRTLERDQARRDVSAEQAAHKQTENNYRVASELAEEDARDNVIRVKAEQAVISERTDHDYEARLADVDARYERVRAQLAARTDLRSAEAAPMSIASHATCLAYGGGSCDELLAKLAVAERQAGNLVELRSWAVKQAAVRVEPVEVP